MLSGKFMENTTVPNISVIIPIYNVENYIGKCIESIVNQSYQDFEIIIVDDGSIDKSSDIAREILKKSDLRFLIFKQKNQGPSAARNKGIKEASGKWISFIDADDMIAPNFLELLNEGTQKFKTQVSFINYLIIKKCIVPNYTKRDNGHQYCKKAKLQNDFLHRKKPLIVPAMLVNKNWLLHKKIMFNENMRFSEDMEFLWKILFNLQDGAVYNRTKAYYYLLCENSLMRSASPESVINSYKEMLKLKSIYSEKNGVVKSTEAIDRWVLGVLRTSCKIMSQSMFVIVANHLNYRKHAKRLLKFNDFKAVVMAFILLINRLLYYLLNSKSVIGQ
jgi:glycosyltransferase involved in cell wall biosynthesis